MEMYFVECLFCLVTFCINHHVCTCIPKTHQDACSPAWTKPCFKPPLSLRPLLLPPFSDNQVTELVIFNSILLLEALRVIQDVWGASRPCHQGLSPVIARCRLPEPKSRSHNCAADGIPRWPRRAPPSFSEPPALPCRSDHRIRLGMWQERGKASEDAWQGCHLDVAAPQHCVNGVLWREWVLMGLVARI